MNKQEAIEAIEKLKAFIGQEEKKEKWSPSGGRYYFRTNGHIDDDVSTEMFRAFGSEGTEEQVTARRDKVHRLLMKQAYAQEHDGEQEFVFGKYNWAATLNQYGKMKAGAWSICKSDTEVYMTERDAKEYARLYNEGLIDFKY